jgi:parvulin-like peptidyl-prolyl isomerase
MPGGISRMPGMAWCVAALLAAGCASSTAPMPYIPLRKGAEMPADPAPAPFRLDGTTGGVVARVNGKPITDWDLEQRLPPPYRDRGRWKDPEIAKIIVRTLRSLVEHRILIDVAQDFGIEVSESDVEEEVRREREDLKLSPEDFKRQVEQQRGQPYVKYLDDTREQLLIQKTIARQLYSVLYVTPRELRDQYRGSPDTFTDEAAVSFKMLVIASVKAGGAEPAKSLADAIRRQLALGGDFDALCATYRSVTSDPARAGVLTSNVPRGRLPAPVEQVLFDPAFSVPGCTPVLPFDQDWAVLYVTERRDRKLKSFEDVALQRGISRSRMHELFIERRNEILREHLKRASVWPAALFPPGYPEME